MGRFLPRFNSWNRQISIYGGGRITRSTVCLLALLCGGWIFIKRDSQEVRAETTKRYQQVHQGFKSGKCKSCHPAIWREWEKSMHARAWTNEIYQEAAAQVADRETNCDRCHAPEPILITGVGKMPKLRNEERDSGVSCLVCHLDAAGAMHGPATSAETSFHENVTNPIYREPTLLCSTCHGQPSVPEHDQVSSFLKSSFAAENKGCATCHMPAVKRLQSTASYESIAGRKHTWPGSRSFAQLRRAVTVDFEFASAKASVIVENRAGHLLPGAVMRVIVLNVYTLAPDGTQRQLLTFPFSEKKSSRLSVNGRKKFVFDVQTGHTIFARLHYQLTPNMPEASWILMAQVQEVVP